MDTERNYRRLASDCLKMAERAHDPATRADMNRLAPLGKISGTGQKQDIASSRSRSRCLSTLR
jgi:hypothetical protein